MTHHDDWAGKFDNRGNPTAERVRRFDASPLANGEDAPASPQPAGFPEVPKIFEFLGADEPTARQWSFNNQGNPLPPEKADEVVRLSKVLRAIEGDASEVQSFTQRDGEWVAQAIPSRDADGGP